MKKKRGRKGRHEEERERKGRWKMEEKKYKKI